MLKPRPATSKLRDWQCRAYIKSSEELSRQAAETHWGVDKEYYEVKRMSSLPPSPSRFQMACVPKFFQGTKFKSVEDQDASSQKSWYLVWDVGLFTSRGGFSVENTTNMRSMARLCQTRSQSKPAQGKHPMHRPQHDYVLESDNSIIEIECPYEFIRSTRAPLYPPPPNLIYGRTIKEESPLPRIKLESSPLQPSRSSSRVVRAMLTPDDTDYYFDSNSPDVSPVSGVHVPTRTESSAPRSAQSFQPVNVSVEEKRKAFERLSRLQSKSSKTAAPVKSKRKSSRDNDERRWTSPPGNVRRRVRKDRGNGSTATKSGRRQEGVEETEEED
ncbi:hypothetical protein B0H14DRAFT_2657718 [Mycena olivaceomarginata]|nr:hypothetical protein B0H14DRAFT_2657718 [Mycena olivaceomarginata]